MLFIAVSSPGFLKYISAQSNNSKEKLGTLIIEINKLENSKGSIQLSLFKSSEGFPNEYKKSFRYLTAPSVTGLNKIEMKDIPFGNYALAVLHDENNDFELDTNFLGIPTEGYGFSNNVKGLFGPPDYDEAKFKFNESSKILKIILNY
jgi:uncharacterized protein (DUF2141 family)